MAAPVDLYSILEVGRTASHSEIRRAYHRLALRHHPDKRKEADSDRFLQISQAYSILSQPESRRCYDETGRLPGEDAAEVDSAFWEAYCRRQVTADRIEQIRLEYLGSSEEQEDVLSIYSKHKGDMEMVLECLMFSEVDDVERYRRIVDDAVASGRVKKHAAFWKWKPKTSNVAKRTKAERKSAALRELGTLIAARRSSGFIDQLERKYSALERAAPPKKQRTK